MSSNDERQQAVADGSEQEPTEAATDRGQQEATDTGNAFTTATDSLLQV